MSDTILVALISAMGALVVSLVGVFIAKTYKIGPNQDKLVQTLKDLLTAQDKKIEELQEIVEESQRQIVSLTFEINQLKSLTISQALMIENLQSQLGDK